MRIPGRDRMLDQRTMEDTGRPQVAGRGFPYCFCRASSDGLLSERRNNGSRNLIEFGGYEDMSRYFLSLGWWLSPVLGGGCLPSSNAPPTLQPEEQVISSLNNDFSRPMDLPSADSVRHDFHQQRTRMVEFQIRRRGIHDGRVLAAMESVPRHRFVPAGLVASAYDDGPLPIGYDQTISQPYIVALMTETVRPQPGDRALDIGTGCGYQAAVLSELVREVYSIEIVEPLAQQAELRLSDLGFHNVQVRHGDGYRGWLEESPFDIIVVAAAPDHIPQPLIDQLAFGGRLIIPVGRGSQDLKLLEKDAQGRLRETQIAAVRFVPMTGEAEQD